MIRLTYRIETPGPVEAMATKIASDQSTGTFVALPGETEELKARVAARVVAIRELPATDRASFPDEAGGATSFNRADVDLDFPLDTIGTDLSALMTIAIGGVFSIKGLTGIRIVDMKLPREFAAAHAGPQFGVSGSFALTGVKDRPIIGTIVKSALGLRPNETAGMVGELIAAGVDFIKDDEKLVSPAYSPLKDRVAAIMPRILDDEQKRGYRRHRYRYPCRSADRHDRHCDAAGPHHGHPLLRHQQTGIHQASALFRRDGRALPRYRLCLDPFYAYWRRERRPGIVPLKSPADDEAKRRLYIAEFLAKSEICDDVGILLEDGDKLDITTERELFLQLFQRQGA